MIQPGVVGPDQAFGWNSGQTYNQVHLVR